MDRIAELCAERLDTLLERASLIEMARMHMRRIGEIVCKLVKEVFPEIVDCSIYATEYIIEITFKARKSKYHKTLDEIKEKIEKIQRELGHAKSETIVSKLMKELVRLRFEYRMLENMVINYESSLWSRIQKWIEENIEPLRTYIWIGWLRIGVVFE